QEMSVRGGNETRNGTLGIQATAGSVFLSALLPYSFDSLFLYDIFIAFSMVVLVGALIHDFRRGRIDEVKFERTLSERIHDALQHLLKDGAKYYAKAVADRTTK
ncbi:hypothetical protein PENTCL1PPCAC_8897, partial [Pristionchus entomophagus]